MVKMTKTIFKAVWRLLSFWVVGGRVDFTLLLTCDHQQASAESGAWWRNELIEGYRLLPSSASLHFTPQRRNLSEKLNVYAFHFATLHQFEPFS